MSPENAKVFVAEDEKDWQELIVEILEDAGHEVTLTASSLDEALAATQKLREKQVQVAIVDGNLSRISSRGNDGQAIIAAIRENAPEVKIVGMSGLSLEGVDLNLGKMNARELGEKVNKL